MIRKMVCLTAILLLGLTTNAFAGWALWEGSVSDAWNNPDNWVTTGGIPGEAFPRLGRIPNYNEDMVGIGESARNAYWNWWAGEEENEGLPLPDMYWPVLHDAPLGGAYGPFSGTSQLFSLNEWSGGSAQWTIDGGLFFQAADQYMMIGRHADDTSTMTVNSGGIGSWLSSTVLAGPTRWLKIGSNGAHTGGGLGTYVQNGGVVYAQAMDVGCADGTGAGSSATVNGGELLIGGNDYFDASFLIGSTASMTINPDGYVELDATELQDGSRVAAMGALNLVADSSGSATLIVPWYIANVTELLAYFGYDDGLGGTTPGNVNAIWDGGAGQFVLSYPGGLYTEVTVIPEPVTIALLGIGGLCLLRRKRN